VAEVAARDQVDQPRRGFVRAGVVGMAQQNPEFVAADPRHQVALAHAAHQKARDLDQRLVARLVAAAVVDQLEPVDVDEQHRGLLAVAIDAVAQPLERAHEAAAVGKVDQRILVGELVQLADPLLEFGDLAAQRVDFRDQSLDLVRVHVSL
jgi:hypothetical protein